MDKTSGLRLGVWSASAVILGFALSYFAVSYLPLYWAGGLVIVFFACFVGCGLLNRRAAPGVFLVGGALYSAVFAWVVFTYGGVERVEQHDCDWKLSEGDTV